MNTVAESSHFCDNEKQIISDFLKNHKVTYLLRERVEHTSTEAFRLLQ